MAVGTGRSANQLHIYSEKGGGITATGRGRGWSLSQAGCSGSAGTQAGPLHSEWSLWAACSLLGAPRAPSCQGAQEVGGGRGVMSK